MSGSVSGRTFGAVSITSIILVFSLLSESKSYVNKKNRFERLSGRHLNFEIGVSIDRLTDPIVTATGSLVTIEWTSLVASTTRPSFVIVFARAGSKGELEKRKRASSDFVIDPARRRSDGEPDKVFKKSYSWFRESVDRALAVTNPSITAEVRAEIAERIFALLGLQPIGGTPAG